MTDTFWKSKGKVWYQKNDDSKIGDLYNETIHKRLEERRQKNDAEGKWNHKDKIYKGLLNELGRRHGVNK